MAMTGMETWIMSAFHNGGSGGVTTSSLRFGASRRNQDRKELLALYVNADDVQPGFRYRVSRGKLTAEQPSLRPPRPEGPQIVRRARQGEKRRR